MCRTQRSVAICYAWQLYNDFDAFLTFLVSSQREQMSIASAAATARIYSRSRIAPIGPG